jgi:RNA polymerase sigma-70 factor (ECF subfamily)
MPPGNPSAGGHPDQRQWFTTTHWSVVLAAGHESSPGAQEALEKLCRTYWYPLYAFARRQGCAVEEAEDMTQEFFARLLAKNYLSLADPARGRFRSFLLTSLKNFLANEWRLVSRAKRGGGQQFIPLDTENAEGRYAHEPVDEASPDKLYEKRWAATVLEQAMDRLHEEFRATGREKLFAELKAFVWGDRDVTSQVEVAARLRMSEGAVNVAVHRMRRRYRELLRAEIADTVASPAEVDEELHHLKAVLSG